MNILASIIHHKTAPLALREALHLNKDEIVVFNKSLIGTIFSEGLVISTCNRTEIYGIPANKEVSFVDVHNALAVFKNMKDISADNFWDITGTEAVDHLFSVITGIESQIIGDNQIYQQVKECFNFSLESNFAGTFFRKIFDAALKTGKRSITETTINEGAVTISYAAVQLIEKIFSSLSKKSALVIGTGETGEIAAKHLKERGLSRLTLTNRTFDKAKALADKLGCAVVPFENFKDKLNQYDIILSATSAPNILINKADVQAAMHQRNYAPMIVMDIAVPRDIDPQVRDIDYVFYHDIDNLNIIIDQNLRKRKEEIPKVKSIIQQEISELMDWYNSLEAGPTIKLLRDWFENIRAEEVNNNINRFSNEDRDKLDLVTKKIVNKILHTPTIELKKLLNAESNDSSIEKISFIREFFGLDKSNGEN